MGSRINSSNLKHIFQCFLEVSPPHDDTGKPGILRCYPETYNEKEKEKIPEFVFPCTFTVSSVELFSFALTNMKGELTFGFCRHAPRASSALCVLSSLPWHEFFYKMLNFAAAIMGNPEEMEAGLLNSLLHGVYTAKIPHPGEKFQLEYSNDGKVFSSPIPDPTRLPSIPENRNLTEYFNFVDINNMIIVFFSMLNERRVVVTSRKLSVLSACVQAANSLLYPFSWQHPFIPVLPAQMLDFLTAPMPFLIGVPDVMLKRKNPHEIKDVVILNIDEKTVRNPFEEVDSLPHEVVSNLKKSLKSPDKMGDHVARSFLQAMVHLIGGYRDALRYRQGEKITFDEDVFVQSRSSSLQPYLRKLLEIQMFQTFKDERLALLNSGKGYSDEFELECVAFQEKSNKKFTPFESVKKDGGALIKKVKNKTNPVVKDAVKNVLDSGKVARERVRDSSKAAKSKFHEVRSKFRDGSNHEQFRSGNEEHSYNSSSAPSSPSQSRRSSVVSGMLVTNNNSYVTLNNSYVTNNSSSGTHHHQMPLRQNTDLGFSSTTPVLKYERFDPSSSATHNRRSSLSPTGGEDETLSPADSEDLMQEIDRVFNAQKPSVQLYSSTSQLTDLQKQHHNSRKASVGDLINLGDSSSTAEVEFDPLRKSQVGGGGGGYRSSQVDATCTIDRSNHRKLSRTDANASSTLKSGSSLMNINTTAMTDSKSSSFLYPSIPEGGLRNNSAGKYQNYVPAGGTAHQAQFKNFMDSMKDPGGEYNSRKKNSSEDLLKDYGLQNLYLGLGGSYQQLGGSQLNVNSGGGVGTSGGGPSPADPRRSFSPAEARNSFAHPSSTTTSNSSGMRTPFMDANTTTSQQQQQQRHNGYQQHHHNYQPPPPLSSSSTPSSSNNSPSQNLMMHQYNNGGLDRLRTAPPPASSSSAGAPTPPPRQGAMSAPLRSVYGAPSGGYSGGGSLYSQAGAGTFSSTGHHHNNTSSERNSFAASRGGGGNNSFLFNSSPVQASSVFQNVDASMLPVNQRLVTADQMLADKTRSASISGGGGGGYMNNNNHHQQQLNNHFLSELDPLCNNTTAVGGGGSVKPVLERTNVTPNHGGGGGGMLPPPLVVGGGGTLSRQTAPPKIPPRSKEVKKQKEQWEKFD